MKKTLFILFFASMSVASFAQAQFALGIKGGPNFASIDTRASAGENYRSRTGFHGGAFALIKLTKIGIQPEFIYSKQGTKFKLNTQDYEANYDYFNVPIVFKLYTIGGINLQAGPQFGFLSGVDGQAVKVENGQTNVFDVAKEHYKSSDLSLVLGAGWDLPFGLTLDARYNLGLSRIQDNPQLEATKNQVWQVSVGYKIIRTGN